ncbi:hypothetical protein L915_07268 [Phytophthora nicotianae]|uniref:Uncharacterized protein n=1 Tax=Phytophthora nicotianae TaxID=4792 RepID=W2H1Q9_PHYNI|nr:hypothetical protein L915_07268 [Phytophthora nicotianae]
MSTRKSMHTRKGHQFPRQPIKSRPSLNPRRPRSRSGPVLPLVMYRFLPRRPRLVPLQRKVIHRTKSCKEQARRLPGR